MNARTYELVELILDLAEDPTKELMRRFLVSRSSFLVNPTQTATILLARSAGVKLLMAFARFIRFVVVERAYEPDAKRANPC